MVALSNIVTSFWPTDELHIMQQFSNYFTADEHPLNNVDE